MDNTSQHIDSSLASSYTWNRERNVLLSRLPLTTSFQFRSESHVPTLPYPCRFHLANKT